MNLFNKFLSNTYFIGNKSPINTLSMLDNERYEKYIKNISTVIENEVGTYKNMFGIIKSTLEDINKRVDSVKDISNYLPVIIRIDIADWTEELKPSTFKPRLVDNIKLPDDIDLVSMAKEYRAKSESDAVINLLLKTEVDEIKSLYKRYIQNNLGATFTSLIDITKYHTLLKVFAIVDMFKTLDPLDNARGSLDGYRALFNSMHSNLINAIKMLNRRIQNAINNHLVVIDYNQEAIAVNPYEYNKLLDNAHSIELIYGACLSGSSKNLTIENLIEKEKDALKEFDNFKTKISLKVTSRERMVLEEAYKQYFNNMNKLYGSIIDQAEFVKVLNRIKQDKLFNIENMLIEIVQDYIVPNSNIKRFVKTIDKYTGQGISIDKAREMAIYRLVVDFLLKDVRKIEG